MEYFIYRMLSWLYIVTIETYSLERALRPSILAGLEYSLLAGLGG